MNLEQGSFLKRAKSLIERSTSVGKAGVLASSLVLSNVAHSNRVEAADIQPHASFEEGSRELQREARESANEIGGTFALLKDGETLWLPPITGDQNSVPLEIKKVYERLEGRGKVERLCFAHTHPLASIKKTALSEFGKESSGETYAPPSLGDIDPISATHVESILRTSDDLKETQIVNMVYTPRGAWSFRELTPTEVSAMIPSMDAEQRRYKTSARELRAIETDINDMIAMSQRTAEVLRERFKQDDQTWARTPLARDIVASAIPATEFDSLLAMPGVQQKIESARNMFHDMGHFAKKVEQAKENFFEHYSQAFLETDPAKFKQIYPLLQKDYLEAYRTRVSFFSYDELPHKPACPDPSE